MDGRPISSPSYRGPSTRLGMALAAITVRGREALAHGDAEIGSSRQPEVEPHPAVLSCRPTRKTEPATIAVARAATVVGWAMLWLGIGPTHGHGLYTGLMTRDGTKSCCNDRDCRPVKYKITSGGVQMLVADQWLRVPESVIQYRTLPNDVTEGGHWCGHGLSIGHPVTVCAFLPPRSTKAPEHSPPGVAANIGS